VALPITIFADYFVKVSRLRAFVALQCPSTVVMVVDAYDTFLTQPAAVALQRFAAMRTGVLMSAKRLYSWQHDNDLSPSDPL